MRIITRISALIATVSMTAVVHVGAAAAEDFGVRPGTFTVVSSGTENPDQAGGHPDIATRFEVAQKNPGGEASLPAGQTYGPAGTIRNVDLLLPPGLIANPQVAKICPMALVSTSQCPADTGIGEMQVALMAPIPGNQNGVGRYFQRDVKKVLYRVEPTAGEVAAFATNYLQFAIRIGVTVGPDGNYRVRAQVTNGNETYPVIYAKVTLWGVPADHQGPTDTAPFGGPLPGAPRMAFTSMPTACDGATQDSSLSLTSWQDNVKLAPVLASLPAATGCDELPFDPSISVKPASSNVGAPSGYTVDLRLPQPWTDPPAEGQDSPLSTAHLKDVKVVLPKGVAISPPVAGGLGACTDDELARGSSAPEACPETSKIGTIEVESPLLDDPLVGSVYVGSQLSKDPESGDMYRIFLTASAPGVRLKLLGQIRAEKATGQLTATFLDNPQLPFSKLTLRLDGGARAPLTTPDTCGTFETKAELAAWSGHVVNATSPMAIADGCGDVGKFAPSFEAGTVNAGAGAHTGFVLRVKRDGGPALSGVTTTLPGGLLADIKNVPYCPAAGAASGNCPADTQVGTTTIGAGAGSSPLYLPAPGKAPTHVYLAGPYKDAPLSLSIVVPAQAGPFDLGTAVVRAGVYVNPETAQVTVKSDPLPTMLKGIPVNMRDVSVYIDRQQFTFNPTSCVQKQVSGQITSTVGLTGNPIVDDNGVGIPSLPGAVANVATQFQAVNCQNLGYKPKLSVSAVGKGLTKDGDHPQLDAHLAPRTGDANQENVKVVLPLSLALDPDNANTLCEPTDAAVNKCPAGSIVGHVKADSILHQPLTGPVYFVRGERIDKKTGNVIKTLPKLFIPLSGEGITVFLRADSEVIDDRLVTTFHDLPDAPFTGFDLSITGGKHGILVVSGKKMCQATQTANAQYHGQNGTSYEADTILKTPCALGVSASSHTQKQLRLTIGGLSAGKVTVSGNGFAKTSRIIKTATAATLNANLSKATRRALARHRNVQVRVTVAFKAKGATTTKKVHKTLLIHGTKKKK